MNQFRTLMAAFEQYRAKHHKLINSYTDKDRHSTLSPVISVQGWV